MCDVRIDNNSIYSKLFTRFKNNRQSRRLAKVIHKLQKLDMSDDSSRSSVVKELHKIKKEQIIEQISMAEMPLIVYLLFLKYDGIVDLMPFEKDAAIIVDGLAVANMSYLAVYIHFIEVRNGVLHIEGNVSQPTIFKERCSFGIKNNGVDIQCQMLNRDFDLKKGVNIYETRTVYTVDIPLSPNGNSIEFYNYFDGNECAYGKINSMRFAPVADCIKRTMDDVYRRQYTLL